jgi:hypothetical protein
MRAMEIEGTTFGAITIDGKTYEHDVIIRLSVVRMLRRGATRQAAMQAFARSWHRE